MPILAFSSKIHQTQCTSGGDCFSHTPKILKYLYTILFCQSELQIYPNYHSKFQTSLWQFRYMTIIFCHNICPINWTVPLFFDNISEFRPKIFFTYLEFSSFSWHIVLYPSQHGVAGDAQIFGYFIHGMLSFNFTIIHLKIIRCKRI